jgi:chaperonin GroEL
MVGLLEVKKEKNMSKTNFIKGKELKEKLFLGIDKLNTAVSSTLGPGGRTVLIKDPNGEIRATKDGVSCAKAFGELEDPIETIGASLVKQVSIKSANEAGDGTTTSTLLAYTMVEEGLKHITNGVNAVEVKKSMDVISKEVIKNLKEAALGIDSEEQVRQVATISGNNDEEVGNLIATAIEKVGRDGIISLEESKTGEEKLEIVEGLQFDKGYKSPYFVTDNNSMQAVLEDAYVMLYDGMIASAQDLLQILTKANTDNKPVLIVAQEFGEEALAVLIVNKMRGIVKVVAVKAPDFGERKTLLMEDMAILTGGTLLSKEKGHKLDKLAPNVLGQYLGTARRVTVDKDTTTIVDGKGDAETIKARAEEIKEQIEKATTPYEKEKLQERLGKLIGGVAIISVGGNSDVEIKEKKDRVEDALFATKAALAEGVVEGGGIALIKAFNKLGEYNLDRYNSIAWNVIKAACYAPFLTIQKNTGTDNPYPYLTETLNSSLDFATFNAKTNKVVNAREEGLLDPVKVTRLALENSVSVAGTILTTESVIFDKKEKKEETDQNNMGMF